MNEQTRNKLLLTCGLTCTFCGLIIFVLSVIDDDGAPFVKISLGIINIINGFLFLGLFKKK